MYKLTSSPVQDIFSPGYKEKCIANAINDSDYWGDLFWDEFMPCISDVLDTLGITVEYASEDTGLYLVFYSEDSSEQLYKVDWLNESEVIQKIWASPDCDCEEAFKDILTKHYRELFKLE